MSILSRAEKKYPNANFYPDYLPDDFDSEYDGFSSSEKIGCLECGGTSIDKDDLLYYDKEDNSWSFGFTCLCGSEGRIYSLYEGDEKWNRAW